MATCGIEATAEALEFSLRGMVGDTFGVAFCVFKKKVTAILSPRHLTIGLDLRLLCR